MIAYEQVTARNKSEDITMRQVWDEVTTTSISLTICPIPPEQAGSFDAEIPASFYQAIAEFQQGNFIDLDTALENDPPL